jgi:hypothetical protein
MKFGEAEAPFFILSPHNAYLMQPVRKADNLTTILCRYQEIWEPNFLEPSEPLQACNGTALPL